MSHIDLSWCSSACSFSCNWIQYCHFLPLVVYMILFYRYVESIFWDIQSCLPCKFSPAVGSISKGSKVPSIEKLCQFESSSKEAIAAMEQD